MKKFSKMLALGMALSLAFGVTAFAADSITVDTSGLEGGVLESIAVEGNLQEGDKVVATPAPENTSENVWKEFADWGEAIKASGYDASAPASLSIATTFEVEVQNADGEKVDRGEIKLTFDWVGFDASKNYAVLHYDGTKWEVIPAIVTADGVKATFTSFSPVVIVEVSEYIAPPDNNNNSGADTNTGSQTTAQPEEHKSPQTGGVLPVAELMALVSLAGSAVCVRRARSNKQ